MNNIKELLSSLNYDFKTTSRDFQSERIEMHITNKTDMVHDSKILAKYLIFDFIENQDLFEKISTDLFLFDEFQRINISPTFFSHRDDIRWNIYTLFVVNNKKDLSNEVFKIEKNEEYSRKFIFNIDELNEFLENGFLGKLDKNIEQKIKTNFLLEWDKVLGKYELNGCLNNKMKLASIVEYIEYEKPIRPIGRPVINKRDTISRNDVFVSRIENIKMNSFRTHCFGKEFSFSPSLVNLISGTNGSGKSSLCEAISFGMTGTNMNKKYNSEEIVHIKCLGANDEIINLSSQKTAKEKKEYDLAWYGTTTTGNKSNLYENYSIFNYLHSNAAHKGINENLDVLLKNIMYGEETTKAWEVINNYKEKFIQSQKSYDNLKTKLQDEIKELQTNIEKFESSDRSYKFEKLDLFGLLHKYSDNVSYETKFNDLNSISFIVSSLEEIIKNDSNMYSVPFIINSYSSLKEKKESLEKQYKVYEELVDRAENLKIQAEIMNTDMRNYNELKTELKKLFVEYSGYGHLNSDSKMDIEKVLNEAYNNENNYKCMNETLNQFNIFKDYKKCIVFLENELIQVNNDLSEKKEVIFKVSNKICAKKSDIELSKQILTEISALGIKYLENHTDTGACPLCGFDYGVSNNIYEAINNVRSLSGNLDVELESLITQESSLNEVIDKLEKRKVDLHKDKTIQAKYSEFIIEMKKYDVLSSVEIPSAFYEACCLKMDELRGKIDKESNLVNFLERLSNNNFFMAFVEQNDINEFSIYIKDTLEKYDFNQTEIKRNLESIFKEQIEIQNKMQNAQIVRYELDKVNNEFIILQKAYEIVNIIINDYSEFVNISDIQNWILNYNNLKSILNDLVEAEKNSKMKDILINQLNGKKQDLERETKSLSRCKRAIEAFNSLPTLEENMATFIEDNAANIERIFKMIHRPEEFTDLLIVSGKVQFTRKTTSEIINIENVSTGQAISLVFAITLCLHFSANNAPKFIVLDEPVANLDDMHIMNLVDILKEIALSGVQLFITTANDQVATYFRRKFSCFNEDFKHLDILRSDEKPSTFSEKIYSPYKEEPIIDKEIAI